MGSLHDGHLALVKRGRNDNATLIASIFVNPTQFGSPEDLQKYPRDIEADLEKLENEGVDIVFIPSIEEMYPNGFDTYVDPGKIASRLEGKHRSGHFRGVATVVSKLFSIFQPDRAYFGQKDFQQSLVIRTMSKDLNFNVQIIVEGTVRDSTGLALSSRNLYLNERERHAAGVLYKALNEAKNLYRNGVHDAERIRRKMLQTITSEPIARIDYVSVSDAQTLMELGEIDRPAVAAVAARFGTTRLIDNIHFDD
jgi:pantoate--beta-alanine ligase